MIFCIVREIDHIRWIILCNDEDVAEEGLMSALEIFNTCIFRFFAEFWWNGIFEVREGFIGFGVAPSVIFERL